LKENINHIFLLATRVDLICVEDLLQFISSRVHNQDKAIISNVNVHTVNIAYTLPWFKDFINRSQVVFCDGYGIKLAARLVTGKVLKRFTPPDWFRLLIELCNKQGFSLFFLGTRQAVIERVELFCRELYPNLKITGVHHGFFDKNPASPENQQILAKINKLKPDILLVGFGMPLQEKWILENWEDLQVKIALPVGALFDYLAGEVKRAPRWMTDHGLEWLGRLIIEPRRLWRRYIIGNPLFFWRIFKHHILGFPLPE
jgi:N-acetylglucosaminyldiphosphoundecaprenol N-acetyl-beta-D-mannosaminyltransferase